VDVISGKKKLQKKEEPEGQAKEAGSYSLDLPLFLKHSE